MATLPEDFDDKVNKYMETSAFQEEDTGVNLGADIGLGIVRGGIDAVKDVYGLLDFVTFDALPDWNINPLGDSQTTAGKIFQGASNFLTGFIPGMAAVRGAGVAAKATKIAKAAGMGAKAAGIAGEAVAAGVAGAATDFLVFDGQEERLSNLIQDTALANPVTEFLAADEEDSELVGRLKNVIEGAGLGVMAEGLLAGLRGVKAMRKARVTATSVDEVNKAIADAVGDTDVFAKASKLVDFVDGKAEVVPPRVPQIIDVSKDVVGLETGVKATDSTHILKMDSLASVDDLKDSIKASLDAMPNTRVRLGQNLEEAIDNVAAMTNMDRDRLITNASAFAKSSDDIYKEVLSIGATTEVLEKEVRALGRKMLETGADQDVVLYTAAKKKLEQAMYAFRRSGTNVGRGLRAFQTVEDAVSITADTKKMRRFIMAHGSKEEIMAEFRRINTAESTSGFISGLTKTGRAIHKGVQVAQEFWVNSILSGPTTQVVNLMSNSFNLFYRPLEGALGATLGGDFATAGTFLKQIRYVFQSVEDAARAAFKVMKSGDNILDINSTMFKESQRRVITGEGFTGNLRTFIDTVGEIVNLPGRFLQTSDEFFKQTAARSFIMARLEQKAIASGLRNSDDIARAMAKDLQGMFTPEGALKSQYKTLEAEAEQMAKAAGIADNKLAEFVTEHLRKNRELLDLDDLASQALSEAKSITFQTPLKEGSFSHTLKEMSIKHPALGFVLPFITTPTNLLKFTFKRLPGLSLLNKKLASELTSEIPEVAARARGRQAMGTMFVASAGMLAAQGLITGSGPEDVNERKILMETGWRPYSFKLGGEYVSFERFEPFSTFFGLIGDIADVWKRGDREGATVAERLTNGVILALTENITSKSYFQGIANAIDLIMAKEQTRDATIRNFFASFVPNLFTKFKGTFGDDKLREVRTLYDAALGKIPGLTDKLPPRRNILGEDVTDRTKGTFVDAKWLNPYLTSPKRNDIVFDELAKYGAKLQNPGTTYSGIDLLSVKNKDGVTAYDLWMGKVATTTIQGKTLRQSLEELIRSRKFQRLPEDIVPGIENPRVDEIRKVISKYRSQARVEAFKEIPELRNTIELIKQAEKQKQGSLRAFVDMAEGANLLK